MAEDRTGLTVAVLRGQNVAKGANTFVAPDMSQDHLEANQGDFGAVNLVVEHNDGGGREVCRGLPSNLQTSPHN